MNDTFMKIFTRRPDKITSGDYFYRIPWIESEQKKYGLWTSTEEELKEYEEYNRKNFLKNWNQRTLSGKFDKSRDDLWLREVKQNPDKSKIYKIFSAIAESDTPVLDLCTSDNMGLLPYLLKLNPRLTCLAQDVDVNVLHRLRRRIDENFPDSNISFTSFDNLDMPLSDNSVPCITGSGFVTNCSMNRNFKFNPDCTLEENEENFRQFGENLQRQAIAEVYRILKPCGLLILDDNCGDVWSYDMGQINTFFEGGELLYGLYSRETVVAKLSEYEKEQSKTVPLEEKLLSAGFEKVLIEYDKWKVPTSEAARGFSETGDPVELPDPIPGENLIKFYGKTGLFILRKPNDGKDSLQI